MRYGISIDFNVGICNIQFIHCRMGNLVNLYNEGRLLPNMISPELYRQIVETDNFRRYLNAGGQDPYPQRPSQNYNMFSFGFPYWNRYSGNFMNPYNVRSGPFNARTFNPFPYSV